MSSTHVGQASLASIAIRWLSANVLPQAFLVAATWVYLSMQSTTLPALVVPGILVTLPHPYWLVVAAAYVTMTMWMRGAVLRPLVPRFSIPGWIAVAILTGLVVLALTVSGSLIGVAVAKGLAASGRPPVWPLIKIPVALFVVGAVLGAEIMGAMLGSLPALVIGALESVVVGRSTKSIGAWIVGTVAAWSMIFALIVLHALLIVFYPRLSPNVLTAIAAPMPILFGLAAALGTLPVVARLARQRSGAA